LVERANPAFPPAWTAKTAVLSQHIQILNPYPGRSNYLSAKTAIRKVRQGRAVFVSDSSIRFTEQEWASGLKQMEEKPLVSDPHDLELVRRGVQFRMKVLNSEDPRGGRGPCVHFLKDVHAT
jgi:hypothetical protein